MKNQPLNTAALTFTTLLQLLACCMMYCTSSVLALQHLRLKYDRWTPLLLKMLCQSFQQTCSKLLVLSCPVLDTIFSCAVVFLHEGLYILTLASMKGTQHTVNDALPVVYLFMRVPCHTLWPSYLLPLYPLASAKCLGPHSLSHYSVIGRCSTPARGACSCSSH